MAKQKLSATDLYSYNDICEMLKTGISYYDFMATPLPSSSMTIERICRILPYTTKTSTGQQLRPIIVPVKEGCSLLPRNTSPSGYVLVPGEYTLCTTAYLQQLLDYHIKKSNEISRLLSACRIMSMERDNPAPPPLFCSKGLRIAVVKADRPNGGEPGFIICSVDANGEKSCRVSSGIWATQEGAQAALDARSFPPRETSAGSICHDGSACFAANLLKQEVLNNPAAVPREYFGQ